MVRLTDLIRGGKAPSEEPEKKEAPTPEASAPTPAPTPPQPIQLRALQEQVRR